MGHPQLGLNRGPIPAVPSPVEGFNSQLARRVSRRAVLGAPFALAAQRAWGSADEVVRVGMSTALSGPAQGLGQGVKAGVEAYFELANQRGGVRGRRLELIALDDQYEPEQTGPNVRRLIDEHQVTAIVGNVGTPTAVVTVPIVNEKRVPFFGAFTGAGILRKQPPDRYVFNVRASYADETAAIIRGLLDDRKLEPEQIAFFTQDDAFGDAGFAAVVMTEVHASPSRTENTIPVIPGPCP